MSEMNIVTAFNRKYVQYACVMMKSVIENNQNESVHFYILQSELMEQDKELARQLVESSHQKIDFVTVNPAQFQNKFPSNGSWSQEAFYRLAMTEIMPQKLDRILYLDVDIIVQKNLHDFYYSDFENQMLIVCSDLGVENPFPADDPREPVFRDFPLDNGKGYFNSGVMLWNLDKMRGIYTLDKYLEKAAEMNYRFYAPDQDLLNYVHWNECKHVDPYQYDLFPVLLVVESTVTRKMVDDAVIIHFGGGKPWKDALQNPASENWWKYAKMTPFYETLMEEYIRSCCLDRPMTKTMIEQDEMNKRLVEEYNQYQIYYEKSKEILKAMK